MSPKRGDRAAPPRVGEEYDIRFDNTESAKGWGELARVAPANLRRAFEIIRSIPRPVPSTAGAAENTAMGSVPRAHIGHSDREPL
ncbi:MAG: hypothetical protein ACRDTE_29935 [Pseudonocardiaceae bacterium]